MRGLRPALAIVLALVAIAAKRATPPGFAEPGDIIAAEGDFAHISAAKGLKAAIHATAAGDAQIFAPQLMRVSDYVSRAGMLNFPAAWHTGQIWMSCDGSVAVTHGTTSATGWYITVWKRQKGGSYRWVLEETGTLAAAPAETDMIAASVADCPPRRARGAEPAAPGSGKLPPADYQSGHGDDGTLAWATAIAADGSRAFTVRIKHDGADREVLRATAAPGG